MADNFYATLAQVLPLLLLALLWDSEYLTRLRGQRRLSRRTDPAGVRFWTKPRVRAYTLTVAAIVIIATAITILALAGLIPDSRALRISLSAGVIFVLVGLLSRISIDIIQATAAPTPTTPPGPELPPRAESGSAESEDQAQPRGNSGDSVNP